MRNKKQVGGVVFLLLKTLKMTGGVKNISKFASNITIFFCFFHKNSKKRQNPSIFEKRLKVLSVITFNKKRLHLTILQYIF